MSQDSEPVPACPRCSSFRVQKKGYARLRAGPLPTYRCEPCGHFFSRLTGTPLSKRRFRTQIDELIALLPQSISCAQAARELGVMEDTVRNLVRLIRRWLLELDPSGHYERDVQMGGHLTAAQERAYLQAAGIVYEDRELTRTLTADFDEIHSLRHEPLPRCPDCGCSHIRRKGTVGLPRFRCNDCGMQFNRRTGTPFSRNRDIGRQRKLIRYLALPLPLIQLSEILEADPGIAARLVEEFRHRCNQIDLSGNLASRISVCTRPDAHTQCVRCGARNVQFDPSGTLPGRCGTCGPLMSLRREISEVNGVLCAGQWQSVGATDILHTQT